VRFFSAAIGGTLWYRAIVPTVVPGERLPVLYLLPGGMSNPADTEERADAVKQAVAERLIIVSPDSGFSWYTNAKHKDNARWEDAIAGDLVRDVDSRFATLKGREHRGLAGVSMGGYGAVKLALKHPELYGFAASMSGSYDVTRRWPNLFNPGQSWEEWKIFGFRPSVRLDEDVFVLLEHCMRSGRLFFIRQCKNAAPITRAWRRGGYGCDSRKTQLANVGQDVAATVQGCGRELALEHSHICQLLADMGHLATDAQIISMLCARHCKT
jgi:pimeloyl-ACP methyl ester carboxylesterase